MFGNFCRGIVLGLLLLTLVLPAVNLKLQNHPKNTALAAGNASVANVITAEIKLEEDNRVETLRAYLESNFGRVQLENSYNPFGWGGGYVYFESFDEAIRTVGFELYERLVKFGADTPAEIGPSYCPPNYIRWIAAVEGFMSQISEI